MLVVDEPQPQTLASQIRDVKPPRNPQRVLATILRMFPDEFWDGHPELTSLRTQATALLSSPTAPDPDVVEAMIKRIGELR